MKTLKKCVKTDFTYCSGVFITNFEQISHLVLMFSLMTLNKKMAAGMASYFFGNVLTFEIYGLILKSHCVKSVQTRSFFWSVISSIRTEYGDLPRNLRIYPNAGKYGPEKTPYLGTFYAVSVNLKISKFISFP